MNQAKIPDAPNTIQKGVPLKLLLDTKAISSLADNISLVYKDFDKMSFIDHASAGLDPLSLLERGKKLAHSLKKYLPSNYSQAMDIILESLTPPLQTTENNGLAVFFYLPHVCFVAEFGLDREYNHGHDPFELSMKAQYELTKRFSSEFSMRPFLIKEQDRTLVRINEWISDPDPHVRRLCSEGTRPRLPWAVRIPSFISDPKAILPILEALKNDESLYVRRSVANSLGDIAKDHLDLVLDICDDWLKNASAELKWVVRHALRHPAKKGHVPSLQLRDSAK
ncbi:MAG: DNA alkylation repair protein [Spirochaetota bacterium]|nr:DNA alkylation repair protein [Spirochaetota bacterium]